MSEIRKAVLENFDDIECIEAAAKNCNSQLVKQGNIIVLKNHNVNTYGRSEIVLNKISEKQYELRADLASSLDRKSFDLLQSKLKANYDLEIIAKKCAKNGISVIRQKAQNGKLKLKLRIVS